ncbi:hypothetical protein B9Z19DRAFT_1122095 [Tuber borchii]|uniref:G domain-containing protein n=1 Tax=Tuber borchii TaxID=42251 RepID=A0A2T7A162_TUBBO|nr:hypothetical protein B9Z19DRAFT_1122095 [Tuber borchii]
MNSQSSAYHPPRCHTPDTEDEFEEPPLGMQSPGSGMLPPGRPQMPDNQPIPGNPQLPGFSQVIDHIPIFGNPQVPGNPQTPGNPHFPHNPQIPGNQQIPGLQQITGNSQMTLYPQMASNLQMSGYPQMPSYPQMSGNTQMAGNPQAPGTPQVHSNTQMASTPQMTYPQVPSNLQMPGYPQFPGYPQMPGYNQMPGYPLVPSYPHPELHLYPSVQHQIYGSALLPDNSTPSCPHTTSLNPNVQSPGMGKQATPPTANAGSLPTTPPKVSPGTEIIIALLGVTGAGKSHFIREVSGNLAVEVSSDLYPCTNKVQSYSFEYAGARITLVDTPGFNGMNRSDTKVLRMIGDWASEAYRNERLLSGIIYLHPITHTRMEGSILKNLRTLQGLCGQEALENVLLTTTQWSRVNWVEGEFRENRLRIREFWGGFIEKGATLQRFAGTRASGLELIHRLMLNKRKPLHIQNQMVKQHMTLLETDAGKCINELLVEQKKKHKEEVESLSLEHQEAIKAKEDQMNETLAAEQAKTQKKLEEAVTEKELLAESHAAEVKQREAEERERQEEAAAYTKSLEEQLVVEIQKRQEEERKRQEETAAKTKLLAELQAAEINKREAERRKRQEEAVAEAKLLAELQAAEINKREAERRRQEEAAAEAKLLAELQAAEIKKREVEERERQEEAVAKTKLLVEQLVAEIKRREAEEREERERREEIWRGEKAVIAVATKDLTNAVHLDTFRGSYSTRGRWILDINNHKEFELNTFAVEIQSPQFNTSSGSWAPVKTLLGLGTKGTGTKGAGSTDYIFSRGAHYVFQSGTSIRRGGQDFFIFMKEI